MASWPTTGESHRAQRSAVLECALQIGEERGEQGLTMRAIANRLGVNQAVLYAYFEDKAALVRELTRVAAARLEAWLAAGVAPYLERSDRLFHLCLALAEFAHVHPWLYRLAFEDAQIAMRSREGWQEHAFVVRATVLLADGGPSERPADPVLVARQLCVAIHGLAMALERSDPEPTFIERYIRALLDGLTSANAARSASAGSDADPLRSRVALTSPTRPTHRTAPRRSRLIA